MLSSVLGRGRPGLCPAPADPDSTVDQVWAVQHPGQYLLPVTHAGWHVVRYAAWMRTGVLAPLWE